jgi:hypothetical protein
MCTPDDQLPGNAPDALRMLESALDYLNGPQALSPQARQALRYAIARLAVDLVSGPSGLAATLRQELLPQPCNSKPVILDIGLSSQVPGHIRRAVALRARHCEWPGCGKRPAACDVHHLRHQADGGETSLSNCVLLCQFHHDICIHRWRWRLILHPDGTTSAHGPRGQVIHSHGHPAADHRTAADHRGTARPDSTPRQAPGRHDPRGALATSAPTPREPARDRDKHCVHAGMPWARVGGPGCEGVEGGNSGGMGRPRLPALACSISMLCLIDLAGSDATRRQYGRFCHR